MSETPTIAELARWPDKEADVTVANIRRALLVWAKVYECRLVDAVESHDDAAASVLATASIGMAMTGILLGYLADHAPLAAEEMARQQWRIGDDGEVGADALLDALDAIDPTLAEAVCLACDADIKEPRSMTDMLHESLSDGRQLLAHLAQEVAE